VGARREAREAIIMHECLVRRSRRYETYTEGEVDRSLRLDGGGGGEGGSKGNPHCAVLDAVYGISPAPSRGPASAAHVALFDGHCGEKRGRRSKAGFVLRICVSTERERGPPSHATSQQSE
jgi:hypothetical protein